MFFRNPCNLVVKLFLAAGILLLPGPASAQGNNVLFILDASNSMWGRVDGEPKIEIARRVLTRTLVELEKGTSTGLVVYGHRRRADCGDVELMVPLGSAEAGAIRKKVSAIVPKGKTPIAASLSAAAKAFAGREGEANNIILISDGIETCKGDPCKVAADLSSRGIATRIHVVGFDVDAKARDQLRCIAKKGGGRYFDAADAGELDAALTTVRKEVKAVAAKPVKKTPPPPELQTWLEDDFEGDALSEKWEVIRPDRDNLGLGEGMLTLIAPDGLRATLAEGRNILRYREAVPDGDWRITLHFRISARSFGEVVRLGMSNGKDGGIFASLRMVTENYVTTRALLGIEKQGKGKPAYFSNTVFEISGRDLLQRSRAWEKRITAAELRLERKGRNYTAAVRLLAPPGAKTAAKWITTRKVSSLRAPGNELVILFGSEPSSYLPRKGEGVIDIDWVRVEMP